MRAGTATNGPADGNAFGNVSDTLLLESGKRLHHEGRQDIGKRRGRGVEGRKSRMGPVVMDARQAFHRIASPPLGLAGKSALKHGLHLVA